jgi:hypothetical protein
MSIHIPARSIQSRLVARIFPTNGPLGGVSLKSRWSRFCTSIVYPDITNTTAKKARIECVMYVVSVLTILENHCVWNSVADNHAIASTFNRVYLYSRIFLTTSLL